MSAELANDLQKAFQVCAHEPHRTNFSSEFQQSHCLRPARWWQRIAVHRHVHVRVFCVLWV